MAKGNPFLSTLQGRIGDVTFRQRNGTQVSAKRQPVVYNPRTEYQMTQRTQLSNIVTFYGVCKELMKKAFEDKKNNQSDYNRFVQLNLNRNVKIYLTKEEADAKACVVGPYTVTKGSIPEVVLTQTVPAGGATQANPIYYLTNIAVDTSYLTVSTGTLAAQNWADLSRAIVEANDFIQDGDQLSLCVFTQRQGTIPKAGLILHEETLDINSSDTLPGGSMFRTWMQLRSSGDQPYLAIIPQVTLVPAVGYGFVISRRQKDKGLKVSTTVITMANNYWLQFTSQIANEQAGLSYGSEKAPFLDPDNGSQAAYEYGIIQRVMEGNSTYNGGEIDGSTSDEFAIYWNVETPVNDDVTLTVVDNTGKELRGQAVEDYFEVEVNGLTWNMSPIGSKKFSLRSIQYANVTIWSIYGQPSATIGDTPVEPCKNEAPAPVQQASGNRRTTTARTKTGDTINININDNA